MKLTDLLPPGEDGTKSFLDWQLEAINSDAKVLGLVGGVGSGKTVISSALGVALSIQVPGNSGIVLRETYRELHDSTWAIFLQVLERANIPGIKYHETFSGFPHRVRLPNRSEIIAREWKNKGQYLGPEYGWFLMDEASRGNAQLFRELMTRLRHGPARGYLKAILPTNPPSRKSWYAELFGQKPGKKDITDPTTGEVTKYHLIRSSTRQNRHLPSGYLGTLLTGNTDSEIARIIDGHFGFSQEGRPVYPQFGIFRNVRDDCFQKGWPVIRGWDFGFHHPACTWHQLWRCRLRRLHWSIHHELDATDIEAVEFIPRVLVDTSLCFPFLSRHMFMDAGDTAGAQVSDKGPGPIIRAAGHPWYLRIRHRKCPIEPGLDLIRKYLSFDCPCGIPGMTVDSSCVDVIEGFQGGYHYPDSYKGQREELPVKDRHFDDFMDSIRYVGENLVRMEEKGEGFLDELMRRDTGTDGLVDPPNWMTGGW